MKPFIYLAPLLLLVACDGTKLPIVISNSCSIDQPILNSALPAGKSFKVGGWAYDKQSGVLPKQVRIQLTSTNRQVSKTFEATLGLERKDVAQALNAPNARLSGFISEVPAKSIAPGVYEIVVLQDMPNAMWACGNGHTIQVK